MKDYDSILREELRKADLFYDYAPRRVRKRLHQKYWDLVYAMVSKMLDENEPLFASDIKQTLWGSLRSDKGQRSIAISLHDYKEMISRKYGIRWTTLEDVLKDVHGNFEKMTLDSGDFPLTPKTRILYKSKDRLLEYIRANTEARREEIVKIKFKY